MRKKETRLLWSEYIYLLHSAIRKYSRLSVLHRKFIDCRKETFQLKSENNRYINTNEENSLKHYFAHFISDNLYLWNHTSYSFSIRPYKAVNIRTIDIMRRRSKGIYGNSEEQIPKNHITMHGASSAIRKVSFGEINHRIYGRKVYGSFDDLRGLFGKFVEFGHKMFKYLYNSFIFFLNITGGH